MQHPARNPNCGELQNAPAHSSGESVNRSFLQYADESLSSCGGVNAQSIPPILLLLLAVLEVWVFVANYFHAIFLIAVRAKADHCIFGSRLPVPLPEH